MEDVKEHDSYLSGDVDEEMWPAPVAPASREEDLLAAAEILSAWPSQGERIQRGRENLLREEATLQNSEAEAAVEEWTAGMVRPPADAEVREPEEEPIEPISRPPLKSDAEAEMEAKYGI